MILKGYFYTNLGGTQVGFRLHEGIMWAAESFGMGRRRRRPKKPFGCSVSMAIMIEQEAI